MAVIQSEPDRGPGRPYCQDCRVEMDFSSESMLCEECLTKPREDTDPSDQEMPENGLFQAAPEGQGPAQPAQDEEIPAEVMSLLVSDDPH